MVFVFLSRKKHTLTNEKNHSNKERIMEEIKWNRYFIGLIGLSAYVVLNWKLIDIASEKITTWSGLNS